MSSGNSKPRARAVVYRYGDGVYAQKWYQRHIQWPGISLLALLVVGLFAVTWQQRVALIGNDRTMVANTSVKSDTTGLIGQTTGDRALADNIVDLQPLLDEWGQRHSGERWSVVAKSIDGPSFDAHLNENSLYEAASLYKLFLTLPLKDKLPLEKWQQTRMQVGDKNRTVAECVDMMIRLSDNPCGEAIGSYVGWSKATNAIKAAGFTRTDLTLGSDDQFQTAASDVASYLQQLDLQLLPEKMREKVLTSMAKQTFRQGIPAGCPGCTVQDKIGNINRVLHDAGIVTYSRGKYVLVIMSEDNHDYREIAKLAGQIQQRILDESE